MTIRIYMWRNYRSDVSCAEVNSISLFSSAKDTICSVLKILSKIAFHVDIIFFFIKKQIIIWTKSNRRPLAVA